MTQRILQCGVTLTVVATLIIAPMTAMAQDEEPSLYERLGGIMGISVVVSDFIDEMVPDPMLNKNPAIDAARKHVPPAYLKYHVTAMVCQAAGGPCKYTGRGMEEVHAHLNITEAEWDRMVEILMEVLEKHNVPEKEAGELMVILGSTKDAIVTGE